MAGAINAVAIDGRLGSRTRAISPAHTLCLIAAARRPSRIASGIVGTHRLGSMRNRHSWLMQSLRIGHKSQTGSWSAWRQYRPCRAPS